MYDDIIIFVTIKIDFVELKIKIKLEKQDSNNYIYMKKNFL